MERALGLDLLAGPRGGVTPRVPDADAAPLPLGLYVHLPWCARKCPYCDFNSYVDNRGPPFRRYIGRVLVDLDQELRALAARRPLASIFIGGGTPSLFPGPRIQELLDGIRSRMVLEPGVEITLEVNPGRVDADRFAAYRAAGVNRLSIGVQSLSAAQLLRLGRLHDPTQARRALVTARAVGFENVNLDMMFALPEQTLAEAASDLEALIELEPEHISYYQLTLEPNTPFRACPPRLPNGDLAADMAAQGLERLSQAGYCQYEVSAHARSGSICRHNRNYWRFGDYLGIGAGAHGKLTWTATGAGPWCIQRTAKRCHPLRYLAVRPGLLVERRRILTEQDCVIEFALNALRLTQGFELTLFSQVTGLPWQRIARTFETAAQDGLLILGTDRLVPTALGRNFLDDLVSRFA